MPNFLIEREYPGAGLLSQTDLREIGNQSSEVINHTQVAVYWVKSYVTHNKLYCIYSAPTKDALLEHASFVGFSANKISLIKQEITPVIRK